MPRKQVRRTKVDLGRAKMLAQSYAPTIERETTFYLAEHEVLFVFNADSHAVCFDEWWGTVGEKAFLAYIPTWEAERDG